MNAEELLEQVMPELERRERDDRPTIPAVPHPHPPPLPSFEALRW